jgi:hypothetical protein
VFIEPVIREPSASVTVALGGRKAGASLTLWYRVEMALNSDKGKTFRRVEKRDLKTEIKNKI